MLMALYNNYLLEFILTYHLDYVFYRSFKIFYSKELNTAGAIEVLFPSIIPEELWQESERWDAYGDQLLKMTDRLGRQYCFGPTHEEVVTEMAKQFIHSYKQLPLNVYQIQTKFRDELSPDLA